MVIWLFTLSCALRLARSTSLFALLPPAILPFTSIPSPILHFFASFTNMTLNKKKVNRGKTNLCHRAQNVDGKDGARERTKALLYQQQQKYSQLIQPLAFSLYGVKGKDGCE